jgi:xanthine dehydrogenase iron-sulfur cluster and FAD-binding subunit A
MSRLFGNQIAMEIGGTVSSTSPITVTPTQAITMDNRLVLTIRTGK